MAKHFCGFCFTVSYPLQKVEMYRLYTIKCPNLHTSTLFFYLRKCRDDSLVKKYGDKVGMGHVQERPHVQLSTSHTHIISPHVVYYSSQSDCTGIVYNHNTSLSQNTTCRVGVTCGQLDMRSFLNMSHPSLPCPHHLYISLN